MDRTPDSAVVFAILHIVGRITESVRRILAAEECGQGYTRGSLVLHWFDLGLLAWRLEQLLNKIQDHEGDISVVGWPDQVNAGLCDLCDRFNRASLDSDEIARALGSDLVAVLEQCCGRRGTLPETRIIVVLRPFQRAFESAVDDRDESLSMLADCVSEESMPLPPSDNPGGDFLLAKLLDGSLLSAANRACESATNGRLEVPAERVVALATSAENLSLEVPTGLPDLVTLDQAAAAVKRRKRSLEHYKTKGKLPAPFTRGGGGKPDLWEWRIIRPWLEAEFNLKLPENCFSRLVR